MSRTQRALVLNSGELDAEQPRPNPYNYPLRRTIREAKVLEFRPITWGACPAASAKVGHESAAPCNRRVGLVGSPPLRLGEPTSRVRQLVRKLRSDDWFWADLANEGRNVP